jgi:hypothetical protein
MPRKVPNIQRIINNDILIRFPALLPRITRVEGLKLSNYFMGHQKKNNFPTGSAVYNALHPAMASTIRVKFPSSIPLPTLLNPISPVLI